MGDSWEDDDFVPVVPQPVVLPSKAAWDDEDAVRACARACVGARGRAWARVVGWGDHYATRAKWIDGRI